MAKRPRTERRDAARAAEKLARQRVKLAALEPGGAPERPIELTTAALVEVQARSLPCLRCEEAGARVKEHEAREVDGRRLRVVLVECPRCGTARTVYFQIVQPN